MLGGEPLTADISELRECHEEGRRHQMFESGNVHPTCEFTWGERVLDAELGTCIVIGLPSKKAAPAAFGRTGVIGTTWVKSLLSGEREWRENSMLKKLSASSSSSSYTMRASSLEQPALREQRSQARSSSHVAENNAGDSSEVDEDDYDEDATDDERNGQPLLASHERNRKRKMKPAKKGLLNQSKSVKTKETKVKLQNRLNEFPNTGLKVETGVLWCAPCKRRMANLKTSIAIHVKSDAHLRELEKYKKRHASDATLRENMVAYFEANPMESGVRHRSAQCPSLCTRPLAHT